MTERIKIFGATPSPYTQKMLSVFRYRHIPYTVHNGDIANKIAKLGVEVPKPVLLPTLLLKDAAGELVATTDSTPIIKRLENEFKERGIIPDDPALAFINYLLEDFGDEWVTKYMFHYRWYFEEDADIAGTILPLVDLAINTPNELHSQYKELIAKRQIDRLWVVGSNDETAELIDLSYKRFLKLMEEHLLVSPFLLGNKPSSSDFSFYGQLTQLVRFDPTPRKLAYEYSSRTVAWVDILEDLSGHDVENTSWTSLEESPDTLKNILKEVGKMYVPALLANADALIKGAEIWEAEIDGAMWKQKTFNYQGKCLAWIKEEFDALNKDDKLRVKEYLQGTGCEILLGE
ncbi:glutathione S-transferase N-terminal domain-containing protein [Gammaproteobacteria bacterium]|jgi:glutathione S-transferase|nr:glutathione S-transferase N-terminal domain-containing protein [Gammaproteobacteria bacterium]MDA9196107.1 glutathione S-transferase N-terminal domain-containing protein [Gammaproteobacteria bacterium]MDB4829404.1 glutathione S-transferase N-terminal domain-containing protein [Gammaproteobacteria bacterium]